MMIGLVATSLLASCKKNNNDNNGGTANGQGFRATTEQGAGNNTRTHIDGLNPTAGGTSQVLWDDADLIKVRNNAGTVLTYQLTDGKDTPNGIFYTGEPHDNFFQPNYTAIYPATDGNTITGEGTAQFTLPATQSYVENSFAKGAMPMMAVSENQTLAFKNVLGGICFPLKANVGAVLTVNRIELTTNGDEALWGTCTTTMGNDGNPLSTEVTNDDATAKKTITLDCGDGVALGAVAKDFIIMVPVGALTSGFTLNVYDDSQSTTEPAYTASTDNNVAIVRNMVKKPNNIAIGTPEGIINGRYKVANNRFVYFSQGNLQYKSLGSSLDADGNLVGGTWRFAEHQWVVIGNTPSNAAPTASQSEYIDLFSWGTSGWNSGAHAYLPYSTSQNNEDYYVGGIASNSLVDAYANADWGVYNNIMSRSGVTIPAGSFRTLTASEWQYLLNNHTTKRCRVGGVNGLALRPYGVNTAFDNVYTAEQWATQEANGAVFLPVTGRRTVYYNTTTLGVFNTTLGYYWSASVHLTGNDCNFLYLQSGTTNTITMVDRFYGFAVRLVCDAE